MTSMGNTTPVPTLSKIDYLSESQVFAGLTHEEMRSFEDLTTMTTCERGKIFFSAHDSPGTIYVLKRGAVRLFRRDAEGHQLTVAMLDAGSIFGESALLGQSHAEVYAEATDECLLCVIPTAQMRELIRTFPQIGLNLLEHVGERLRRAQELSSEMAYWTVQRRLAHQLEQLAERYGHPSMIGGTVISKTLTQTDLAEMVGATRQTVSELMSSLAKQGIVSVRRRKIVIHDAAALREFAERTKPRKDI